MTVFHKIVTVTQVAHGCGAQPITGFDIGNPAGGYNMAMVYETVLDERQLIASLRQALDRAPYFAGRVVNLSTTQPQIIANNAGVLFSCATLDAEMPHYDIDNPLKPHMDDFVHYIDHFGFDQYTPLMQIKLSKFRNGCILGISVSHLLADGVAVVDFIQAWADYSCRRTPSAPPYWDRTAVKRLALGDGAEPSSQAPIVALTQPLHSSNHVVDTALFRLPSTQLEELYRIYGGNSALASRQDIVTAYLFKLITRCNTEPQAPCSLTLVYNTRPLLDLAPNYLGNAISLRHTKWQRDQVAELGIIDIAQRIRALSKEMTAVGLRQDLAFWEEKMRQCVAWQFLPQATYLTLQGGVLIDNVSKFTLYEMDFGTGLPVWFDTPPPPTPAYVCRGVLMCPTPPGHHGIDLHISLPSAEMKVFRELIQQPIAASADATITDTESDHTASVLYR